MTNETWQTLSQVAVALGIMLTALGGYGAYVFGKRVDREKEKISAYSGELKPTKQTLLSATNHQWPQIEFGDSGSVLSWEGTQGESLIKFGEDNQLTIVKENGQVKVSTIIRDKTGRAVAELVRNEWKVNPNNSFDRNYSSDALEVKAGDGDIVLQVKVLSDRIQLQAKFFASNGRGFAFVRSFDPNRPGGMIEVLGDNHPTFLAKIEPMFKYPSERHLGELAN